MIDWKAELALADKNVLEAEQRIVSQRKLIADLEERKAPTKEAWAFLFVTMKALEDLQRHRQVIRSELADDGNNSG